VSPSERQQHGEPVLRLVTRVTPAEWELLRRIRLQALATDPLSFGSTYELESIYSPAEWKKWAVEDSDGDQTATFIAREDGNAVGIVGAYRDEDDPELFHIVAMWVALEARRRGLARELLACVEGWIRSCGGRTAHLHVTTVTAAARRLYEKSGYEPDGKQHELPHAPAVTEISLRKALERFTTARRRR
jgi:ribosomal protein S18 acetylase RimI-like enzyme